MYIIWERILICQLTITVEETDQRMPFLRHRDLFVGFNFILQRKNLQKHFQLMGLVIGSTTPYIVSRRKQSSARRANFRAMGLQTQKSTISFEQSRGIKSQSTSLLVKFSRNVLTFEQCQKRSTRLFHCSVYKLEGSVRRLRAS